MSDDERLKKKRWKWLVVVIILTKSINYIYIIYFKLELHVIEIVNSLQEVFFMLFKITFDKR